MKLFVNKIFGWFSFKSLFWTTAWLDFWRPISAKIYLAVLVFLNLAAWALSLVIKFNLKDRMVIFHYTILFGIDYIAKSSAVFRIPIYGLFFIVFNFAIALFLHNKRHDRTLTHILLGAAIVVNVFLLVSLMSIYSINYIHLGK
ncbi:MAG: hypothetical protein PHR00_02050 [Patescibacteria group bacterium]|nr:hypothetical protein [Patescibacteria group bacterium]